MSVSTRTVTLPDGVVLELSGCVNLQHFRVSVVSIIQGKVYLGDYTAKAIRNAVRLYKNVTRLRGGYYHTSLFRFCLGSPMLTDAGRGKRGLVGRLGYRYGKTVVIYKGLNLALDSSFRVRGF